MPPAKNPTSRSSHPGTFREPAALKWLSSSLDTAQQALVELRRPGTPSGSPTRTAGANTRGADDESGHFSKTPGGAPAMLAVMSGMARRLARLPG